MILGVSFNEKKLVKVPAPPIAWQPDSETASNTWDQKALESFYALGPQASARIMARHTIHPMAKLGSLPPRMITALTAELSTMTLETDARKIVQDNIKRLKAIGSYRGKRHQWGLPVRGQRTQGNQCQTAAKLNKIERYG